MKTFISNNWKKILIALTIVFIFINIINKWNAPHILVEEYGKYGPEVQKLIPGVNLDANEMLSNAQKSSPFDERTFGIVIMIIAVLIITMLICDLANRKAPAKKK